MCPSCPRGQHLVLSPYAQTLGKAQKGACKLWAPSQPESLGTLGRSQLPQRGWATLGADGLGLADGSQDSDSELGGWCRCVGCSYDPRSFGAPPRFPSAHAWGWTKRLRPRERNKAEATGVTPRLGHKRHRGFPPVLSLSGDIQLPRHQRPRHHRGEPRVGRSCGLPRTATRGQTQWRPWAETARLSCIRVPEILIVFKSLRLGGDLLRSNRSA